MEGWEVAFREKSERRRRRPVRHRLIRRGALMALIAALILLSLWAFERLILALGLV